jgi:pyruvate formate lyase activating enzyme
MKDASVGDGVPEQEAALYDKLENGRVRCGLCAHRCVIDDGKRGVCAVRENRGGTLVSLVYGRLIARHVDPIEKKPLFHYLPGTAAYSIATVGCNFGCRWCQNWQISQMPREQRVPAGDRVRPEAVVRDARRARCSSIAYTYTEPTVFFETAYEIAVLAREASLANVYVTNGYMTQEMLDAFHPYLDAANVDLKAFKDDTYQRYMGARLQPVLATLQAMKRQGVWVEVTTLIVPGVNDDPGELRDLASFIAGELGKETPWHVSRFHPTYRLTDRGPTPVATLQMARDVGLGAGLHYVYVGNVWEPGSEDTHCPHCGTRLIRRHGFAVREQRVQDGRCPDCRATIAGVWKGPAPVRGTA